MARFTVSTNLKLDTTALLALKTRYEKLLAELNSLPSVPDPTGGKMVVSNTFDNGLAALNTLKAKYTKRLAELGG